MADPGAISAAVAQITTTSGSLGPIVLGKTLANFMKFSQVYENGDSLTFVIDDGAKKEIVTGVYSSDSLTIVTLVYSTTGALIDWGVSGQRVVRPIAAAGMTPEPIEDDDTCDMQNVYSGTSI